jgi:hypothetical protein
MNTQSRLTDIHAQILRQHIELRARLRGIERLAKAVGKAEARHHLCVSLAHFAAVFEEHLAFEERELVPIMRDLDAWGPVRVAALQAEHVEQRTRVERIVAFSDAPEADRQELEGEVHWLAQSLCADMSSEEMELVSLEELDTLPQMTG